MAWTPPRTARVWAASFTVCAAPCMPGTRIGPAGARGGARALLKPFFCVVILQGQDMQIVGDNLHNLTMYTTLHFFALPVW